MSYQGRALQAITPGAQGIVLLETGRRVMAVNPWPLLGDMTVPAATSVTVCRVPEWLKVQAKADYYVSDWRGM